MGFIWDLLEYEFFAFIGVFGLMSFFRDLWDLFGDYRIFWDLWDFFRFVGFIWDSLE